MSGLGYARVRELEAEIAALRAENDRMHQTRDEWMRQAATVWAPAQAFLTGFSQAVAALEDRLRLYGAAGAGQIGWGMTAEEIVTLVLASLDARELVEPEAPADVSWVKHGPISGVSGVL